MNMEEMICITCPMGCHLSIRRLSATEISVTGNRCARGEAYAREELLSPKRVVTTTCAIAPDPAANGSGVASGGPSAASLYRPRRIPVRTRGAFPREKVPELLRLIFRLELRLPVERGQVVLADALGTGVDVVTTRTM
jgi:CxxC motif-containing protein